MDNEQKNLFVDEEYEEKVGNFYIDYEQYILNNTIPEAVAYYIKDSYYRNLLSPCPIINHINSAIDVFYIKMNLDDIYKRTYEILINKYNLKIINPDTSKIIELNK